MKVSTTRLNIIEENAFIFKPNYHLNYGKQRVERAIQNGYSFSELGEVTSTVFTGGIFKRVFVENMEYGLPYISAQHMMNNNPKEVAKTISKKYTPRQKDMSLKREQMLVSCAGTVGNVRLITEDLVGVIGSQDIIRVDPDNEKMQYGYLYAYLSSPTAYNYIQSYIYGSVVPRITPSTLIKLPIPLLPKEKQAEIHQLIVDAAELRVEANRLLEEASQKIKDIAGLNDLSTDDYEYFGNHSYKRKVSAYSIKSTEVNALTINAFNYSRKIKKLKDEIRKDSYLTLAECLDDKGLFNTGSFKRLEIDSPKAIKLINQSDIFNAKKIGKMLSRRFIKNAELAEYGEVLIAGVGTLGEGETFCRVIFVNEELEGQLLAGEFIRMNANQDIPSGYLYAWLNTDYGFRLIRSCQTGTKLCRPIKELLLELPVPKLEKHLMIKIDKIVKDGHTKLFLAITKENQAISLIEKEIDLWQN